MAAILQTSAVFITDPKERAATLAFAGAFVTMANHVESAAPARVAARGGCRCAPPIIDMLIIGSAAD